MASKKKGNEEVAEKKASPAQHKSQGRRYVGTKETIAFILFDVSASFNIDRQNETFLSRCLVIDYKFRTVFDFIVGIWDIINDIFLAAIIDRTRTRFGKFRPYLILYMVYGVPVALLFRSLPLLFASIPGGLAAKYTPKLVTYVVLSLFNSLTGTLNGISRTGIIATITPDIRDRTRLITAANLLSGFCEKLPEQLLSIFMDIIDSKKGKIAQRIIETKIRKLFVVFGVGTVAVSGMLATYFAIVTKERVPQSVDKPRIIDSFKSIITNKPLLILTLSDFVSAFSLSSGVDVYYKSVLNFSSMYLIVGIPGAIISPLSYSYVPWARERFSSKLIWIFTSHCNSFLMLGVFFVGSINHNYKKLKAMIPAFMLQESLFMSYYGLYKVIPEELRNEAIDYCEWKNGFRTEGMTGVAKNLAQKLVTYLGGSIKTFIMSKIGVRQGEDYLNQTSATEYKLFMMCTLLPFATGIFGLIPKLFYNIDSKTRKQMYEELAARRAAAIMAHELEADGVKAPTE
ncbi:MAG: MFS transporter [Clostridiales bacterium]|nr:MFS transporter [Clostridiales bacterium]